MSLLVQAISEEGQQTDWLCERVSYEISGDVHLIREGETVFTLGPEDYSAGFSVVVLGAVSTALN
ncbi:conserved hypothetical protein [Roseibium sp. TrichSKD4]|uniref:hypothetical protein n=1 Tax=Roseibium sp. TrichSKD4 TaxID=744980 RepID=UPI0001E56FC7|nr:hypothetical protein [Roseibium sp. TrichSKD4]EFO31633.1 conserved hypothetical protein [Roseibium sp. TrichSKD4]